jgi:hypothetical protein
MIDLADVEESSHGNYEEWDWRSAILQACYGDKAWQARKFIEKLEEHKRRYPGFMPQRVAAMFLRADPKTRGWYCYQPVSSFTKSIHKARSFRSFAASQS